MLKYRSVSRIDPSHYRSCLFPDCTSERDQCHARGEIDARQLEWNLLPEWISSIRDAAWLQGWYDLRRIFQTIFIAVILLFLFAWFLAILRNSSWQLWLPISATTLLLALSIVRAVSLHAVDMFLYQEWLPGVRPNWVLELGGILVLSLSAILALFFPKPASAEKNK